MTRKPSSPAKVLSDVVMHSQPHSLVRPKREAKVPAQKTVNYGDKPAQTAPTDMAMQNKAPAISPEPTLDELRTLAYREGYAKGMQEGHAAGKQVGFDVGLEAGRESGMRTGQSDLQTISEQKSERFDQLIKAISDEIIHRLYMVEEEMVSLVYGTICRVVGQVAASEDGVRQIILQAISELRNRPMASIRLCPDDFAWMQEDKHFSTILSQLDRGAGVQILADDRVKLGGCIIDSPEGSLDARLEIQLQKISATLLQVFRARAERIKSGQTS
jgi:flagellar assembly protein FliH